MNEKSVFKWLSCRTKGCKFRKADATGKMEESCPRCGSVLVLSRIWHYRLTEGGKTTVTAGFTRRKETEAALIAAKEAIRKGALLSGKEKSLTWADAKKEFLAWVETADLKPKTREFYGNGFKHLDSFFTANLNDITVGLVEEYRDLRRGKGVAPKSVAEEIKLLKRMYAVLCRRYSIRTNPMLHAIAEDLTNVEMPRYNNKRTRFLKEDEVKLLLGKCDVPHLKLAIMIALSTGLRHANTMALEWKQFDFINKTITFKHSDMKSDRTFTVPMMEHLSDALVAWRKEQKRITPYVFPSVTAPGQHMANMKTSWVRLLKICNADLAKQKKPLLDDIVWHSLRHSFASHWLMNGGDLSTLSELLDHSSIQITKDRYGHLSSEHKKRAVDQFSTVFFGNG